MQKLAYLGLGIMGGNMAANLVRAGYEVAVWNRTAAACAPLKELGAEVASTPADAVRQADVVLYCLSNEEAIEAVVFGDEGVVTGASDGKIIVDMSTVHPATSKREAEAIEAAGAQFLDAPVLGSRDKAEAGTLTIVAGGPVDAFDTVRPILEVIGGQVFHMGDHGAGATAKLAGNLLLTAEAQLYSEAMLLASKNGIKVDAMAAMLRTTPLWPPLFELMTKTAQTRDFGVNFPLKHAYKDTNLIAQLASEVGAPGAMGSAIRETLKAAVNQGWGDENFTALLKMLETQAGHDLG